MAKEKPINEMNIDELKAVKDENGKINFAHTINGSGLAIDRVIASILEIYQNEDNTITIPKKLIPYMRGLKKF